MPDANLIVSEYEVFNNAHNALAFFFYQHAVLDQNTPDGPFAFSIHDNSIFAGTAAHHVVFPDVTPDIIDIARNRGVIMMMEFEGQQPVRCTPCYLSEAF
jgi:hypothetical protein